MNIVPVKLFCHLHVKIFPIPEQTPEIYETSSTEYPHEITTDLMEIVKLNYTRSKWSECSSNCGIFSWKGINRRCNRKEFASGYCSRRDLMREIVHCWNLPKCDEERPWSPPIFKKEACIEADVTFIIDSSSSIGEHNFAITRMFIAKLIDASIGTYR